MRLLIALLLGLCLSQPLLAAALPDADQIKQDLAQAKSEKNGAAQPELVQSLEATLNFLDERDASLQQAQQYQQVIDDFPRLARDLRQQIASLADSTKTIRSNMSSAELDQEILQVSSQLLEESRQAQ